MTSYRLFRSLRSLFPTMSTGPKVPPSITEFLSKYKDETYVEGWAELWNKSAGDRLPWDRGFPNPALEDTLVQKRSNIGTAIGQDAQGNRYRKKALVPGCGRGVDVLLLASFGYDAYGLEYSGTAVDVCKEEQAKNGDKYPVRDAEIGQGKITFVQGDFFHDAWLEKLQLTRNCFDLIYDYTFFCALNPSMRPQWALRHTQLLASAPRGHLICLEFPRHKNPSLQGPPWGSTSEAYLAHLSHPGEDIPYDANRQCKIDPSKAPSEQGLEQVAYWQPDRTHEVGKNEKGEIQDRVSIWCRRG